MHNKKFLPACILLSLLLFILGGCGCSIETVEEHNSKIEKDALERSSALEALLNQTDADETSTTVPDSESDALASQTDSKADENTDTVASSPSNQTAADRQTAYLPSNASASSETVSVNATPPTADKTAAPTSTKAAITTDNETKAKENETTTPQKQTTVPYIKVHVTVTCSKVIDSPDLSTSAMLPDDGIILDTYVAVKDGDSVFTALKAAADDNGISLSYTGSKGSVYVAGINGLNEKQCGRYSGWKYSVNNVYPNVGCGGYTLSDGDSILFGYVSTYTDTY